MGENRERVKVEIPIFGKIDLDQDDRDAMSLPPKTAECAMVTEDEMEVQKEVYKAKIRYGRRDKLIGEDGKIVEEEQRKTYDELVEENIYK